MNIIKISATVGLIALSILTTGYVRPQTKIEDQNQNINTNTQSNIQSNTKEISTQGIRLAGLYDAEGLEAKMASGELPVAEIEFSQASSSGDTLAVLIPQNHRYPGTEIMDKRNDSAEITQKEIYEILSYLDSQYGLQIIMNEGDIYGQENMQKVASVKKRDEQRRRLQTSLDAFRDISEREAINAPEEGLFVRKVEEELAYLDREIALSGAAYLLMARNENIALVGAENPDTYQECSDLVRDYTYQKDQLSTCRANGGELAKVGSRGISSSMLDINKLTSLLDSLFVSNPSASLLDLFYGQKNSGASLIDLSEKLMDDSSGSSPEYRGAVDDIVSTYAEIEKDRELSSQAGATNAPRRSDNPYADITDINKLEEMIDESEKKIEEKVIVQRNEETAENFKRALEDKGQSAGIIQFGAGHTEGLVAELNKRGVDVLIVKSDEVLKREQPSLESNDEVQLKSMDKASIIEKLIKNN